MFRASTFRLISEKWAVCSAQIQSLIVDGQNDPSGKLLQSARGFLRDVDLERVVNEADDALELLYFMQRVDYPKGSKLETNASEWLQRNSDTFDVPQLKLMCQYAIEKEQRVATNASTNLTSSGTSSSSQQLLGIRRAPHISAVELWHRAIFQRSWFRSRTQEWIGKLDLGALLSFAKVASWSWDAAASQSMRSKSEDMHPGTEDINHQREEQSTTTASMAWNDRNDSAFLRKALLERCAALLLDTVSSSTTTTVKCTLKKSAFPLAAPTLVELTHYVLPATLAELQAYGQSFAQAQLFACVDAHVTRLSRKDAVKLLNAIAAMPSLADRGYAATRIVLSVVHAFQSTVPMTNAVPTNDPSSSDPSWLALGTVLGAAALKVLQSVGRLAVSRAAASGTPSSAEHPPLLEGIASLCAALASKSCLPPSLEEATLTPDNQELLVALATLIAGLQTFGSRGLSTTFQSTCAELGASLPLQLLLASTLFDGKHVDVVWAAWCRKSVASGKAHSVTPTSAKCAIRALATIFLGDDSSVMGREASPFSWLQPGTAALQQSMLIVHSCTQQILDARHTQPPSVSELCSIMFVLCALEEKYAISSSDGGGGGSHKLQQKALTEQLLQRIAHSSKFSTVGAVSSWQWNFDMTRMVIHSVAAAECGHVLQSYANVMEQLHRVIQQELSDAQCEAQNYRDQIASDDATTVATRKAASGNRTVGACAGLLIALSDAQFSKTQLARNVLQMMVLLAPQATAAELARCLTILPIVNMRDIHAACTFMRELRDRDALSYASVVEAGDAARRLRMTQHFQQCRVSERVTSLLMTSTSRDATTSSSTPAVVDEYLPLEMFSVLISACTIDEQRRLFQLAQSTEVPRSIAKTTTTPADNTKKSTAAAAKRKVSATPSTAAAGGDHPKSTIAMAYLAALPSFLAARPSTALMMLACPECPMPFLQCVVDFLKTSKPLSADDAETSAFLAAVSSVDEMIAKQTPKPSTTTPHLDNCPSSATAASNRDFLDNLFTEVTVFGTELVLQLDESSMMQVVAASGRVGMLPNRFFRVIGRRITPLSESMTAENALSCLELYAKYNIRDDRVVKALLSRCIFTMGMIGGSVDLSARLRRVNATFPHWSQGAHQALQKYSAFKARRERRMV